MNASFKLAKQRLIYFLTFVLCMQCISTDLLAGYSRTYQNIEDFELEKKVDQVLFLIQKRLAIMHEVSRTKWNQELPIEDKIREQQILIDLAEKAKEYNLDEKWIAKFFQAQMDAAKEIQKRDFILWQKEGIIKFEEVFSLKEELRSYIDQINQEMMILLGKIYQKNRDINSRFILDQFISNRKTDFIEKDVWLLAISPFKTY